LHILPHDALGGVEIAARSMAVRRDLPCDFTLLLLAGPAIAPRPENVQPSPFRSALNPLAHLRALRLTLKLRPAVVIASLWKSVPTALLIRLLRPRTRLAFFLHAEKHVHLVDGLLSRLAIYVADEIWADSAVTLQARLIQPSQRGRVLSFVTERAIATRSKSLSAPILFVSWCRLVHQKGLDRALRFIAELNRRGTQARLEAWGPDGGELAGLQALARELGIEQQVTFPGPIQRERLGEVAAEASFFLALSRFEGMAMGTVEAMQLGLVPVTTAVGEMGRYVLDGKTGLIVNPDDFGPALDRIAHLTREPTEYERLRRNAVARWQDALLYADDVCRAAHFLVEASGLAKSGQLR
jgi:glycosyltransferase involved in cell wall biosynthesis